MSSPNQRKRPAPGTSPSMPMQPIGQQFPDVDPLMRWTSPDNSGNFVDDGSQGLGSFGLQQPVPPHFPQPVPATPSNMLARRVMNRALIPTGPRASFDANPDPWASLVPADPSTLDPTVNSEMSEQENLQHLEQLALKAKRDAEAKRKQIPPFVQKLSSFLNEGKNEDLIRWSEKGDSFIVVDEEEFAKKLIPELFKHNNYASFVRQLNMYGFHKRVGLSDNSMRASERKNKSPSEYSNPYFRRGHPNLLWLITKPKSSSKAKKSAKSTDPEVDSDEETGSPNGPSYSTIPGGMSLSETGAGLKKKELALIRDEFKKIREHQQVILQRMQRLEQNQQRIEQQQRAQQQKDQRVDEIYRLFMRHETSLQSMMQILAYHFKKTLEDNKSAQQIKDIMATGFLPGGHGSHGIVELEDFVQNQPKSPSPMGVPKRARALLEAPPTIPKTGNARTVPASPASAQGFPAPEMGSVTEILDASPVDTTSPPYLPTSLSPNSQEKLLRMFHDANASAATASMSSAQPNPLAQAIPQPSTRINPPQQIPNLPRGSTSTTASTVSLPPHSLPSASIPVSAPTAGLPVMPPVSAPPVMPVSSAMPSNLGSLAGVVPDPSQYSALTSIPPAVENISYNSKEYEHLKKLQAAQDAQIQLLGSKIAPLSPSGQLPGFGGPGDSNEYFSGANFDLNDPTFNEFINSDPFSGEGAPDLTNAAVPTDDFGHDFDFSLIDQDGGVGGANATDAKNIPSPSGTEEILRDDIGGVDSPDRGSKRRKVQ